MSKQIKMIVSHINETQGHIFSNYDIDLDPDNIPTFQELQREHGRCVSKMYIDTTSGNTKEIGWVFTKREKYTDSPDTYLKQTWVSFLEVETHQRRLSLTELKKLRR